MKCIKPSLSLGKYEWSSCVLCFSDDHGFSPLHWACREGRSGVVDMLIMRGARINVMNRGDDTPLHLASSHGHKDIVAKVNILWLQLDYLCPVYTAWEVQFDSLYDMFNASWFSAKPTPIQSTSMGTRHSTTPASGAKTRWLRYSTKYK